MPAKKGIFILISGNTPITDAIGEYELAPAIFSFSPAPRDAECMLITITQITTDREGACRSSRGGNVFIDVHLWDQKGQSDKVRQEVGYNLWRLLDRATFTMTGFEDAKVFANLPIELDDPDNFPGYLVSCRVLMRES